MLSSRPSRDDSVNVEASVATTNTYQPTASGFPSFRPSARFRTTT